MPGPELCIGTLHTDAALFVLGLQHDLQLTAGFKIQKQSRAREEVCGIVVVEEYVADTVTETEKTWVSCIKARTRGNVSAYTVSGLTLKVLDLTEAGEDLILVQLSFGSVSRSVDSFDVSHASEGKFGVQFALSGIGVGVQVKRKREESQRKVSSRRRYGRTGEPAGSVAMRSW